MDAIWILFAFAAVAAAWRYLGQERSRTARHLFYNRVAHPILVLPLDPFDSTFESRVKEVHRLLIESGNPYKVPVIANPYFAPVGSDQTVTVDFQKFVTMQIAHYNAVCEQWAQDKFGRVPETAMHKIAGQKIELSPN